MKKNLVILGGGISGLSLLWYLKRSNHKDYDVTLIEKSDHLGGWFKSIERDGFIFDVGPHYLFGMEALEVLKIVKDLNLEDEIILGNLKANVSRVYKNGKLHVVPKTNKELLKSPLTKGLYWGVIHDLFTKYEPKNDESIHEFISRRFSTTLADHFSEIYMASIVSGDMKKLSAKSYLPRLINLEKEYGSVVKGLLKKKTPSNQPASEFDKILKTPVFNFKKGIETFTKALASRLKNDILHANVKSLTVENEEKMHVVLENGQTIKADHVFSTLPTFALAEILPQNNSLITQGLNDIYYKSMVTLSIGYNTKVLDKEGYGYVIPYSAKNPIVGVLFDSSVFPDMNSHADQIRLTVMVGEDYLKKTLKETTDEELKEIALNEVKNTLNISVQPDFIEIHRLYRGIPRFYVGHTEKVDNLMQELKNTYPNMTFLGSGLYGAAITKCIAMSKNAVSNYIKNL